MLDDTLLVDVRNETSDKLMRWWVSIADRHGCDIVKRKSVILCEGKNEIRLRWEIKTSSVASMAVLYKNFNDIVAFVSSGVGPETSLRNADTVTLVWHVDMTGGIR